MSIIIQPGDWISFTVGVNESETRLKVQELLNDIAQRFNQHGVHVLNSTAATNVPGLRIDAVIRGSNAPAGPLRPSGPVRSV